MMEALEFIWMYLIVIPLMLSLFVLPIIFLIRNIKKEMNSGKTFVQALKSQHWNYRGIPYVAPQTDYKPFYMSDQGYSSSRLASDPAFACSYGNLNHRR